TTTLLSSVSFIDVNNGWVAGGSGKILKTTDGGTNWSSLTSGTGTPFYGISFTDANNGTVIGMTSIYRTTDGGTTWVNQPSGTGSLLWDVDFIDANNGFVVGDAGTILKTTNGGTNWVSLTTGVSNILEGVSFTDLNNGTACGIGVILRTTDGGTTWINQPAQTTNILYGVSFTDAANGTAVGSSGTILRTTNGGGIIPVELTSFNAYAGENGVTLSWQTATETNNRGFEVQRSEIGGQKSGWEKIGFVNGSGTTTEQMSYTFIDNKVERGTYYYRLKQVDFDGTFKYSNEIEVNTSTPLVFNLEQNYPNPFNPVTSIKYSIPNTGTSTFVQLKVYNSLGEEVATLVNQNQPAGNYEVKFSASGNGKGLSSGVYIYRLTAGNYIAAKKLVLLK
ncbi:MAG TPA: YCF48-related protein, partial [Ignavibacteriaceae bacterium]|nr:YCF48-related protein [Ignavibacteriaceae bacterium]